MVSKVCQEIHLAKWLKHTQEEMLNIPGHKRNANQA
jgi:hypothetical protein